MHCSSREEALISLQTCTMIEYRVCHSISLMNEPCLAKSTLSFWLYDGLIWPSKSTRIKSKIGKENHDNTASDDEKIYWELLIW